MALSKKALQLKREKKKKKRQMRLSTPVSSTAIAHNNWPIYECWIPSELWNAGIGQVIVSRQNNQGDIAIGIYLIDVFCLGVKDCFIRLTQQEGYHDLLEHMEAVCGELELVDASYACTLIHKAVNYAQQFGLKPHEDFSKAQKLLKNIPIDETQAFTFGKDGKPFYMQGPHESPADVKRILKILASNQGTGDYDFIVETPDPLLLLENEQ